MKHIYDRENGATSSAAHSARPKLDPTMTTCKTCKTKFAAVVNFKNEFHQLGKTCYTLDHENNRLSTATAAAAKPADITTQKTNKQAGTVTTTQTTMMNLVRALSRRTKTHRPSAP